MRQWQLWFLAAAAVYFVLFLFWDELRGVPEVERQLRWLRLFWIFLPDFLITQWVGGEWSRFGLLDHVAVLAGSSFILALSVLLGAMTLDVLRVPHGLTRLETLLFSVGVGANLLSLLTLAAGLAGMLGRRWWLAALAALILLTAIGCRKRLAARWTGCSRPAGSQAQGGWFHRCGLWFSVPFAAAILLGGILPPWHFDVREYHAQVPKEWFQQGSARFMPHNVYGNMPLGAEMHLIPGMELVPGDDGWWWGTLIGKGVIASFAPLAALAIYALGTRYLSAPAGAIGAFLFLSTPWVAHVSMAGLIEGASAFYLTLTLFALLLWFERPLGSTPGLAALAGFLAGAAVACKYPALLFVAVPAGALIGGRMLLERQFVWRAALVFALAFSAGCGVWLVKNAVLTGNPTYPLLHDWFDGATRTDAKDAQWSRAHRAPENGFTAGALVESVELLALRSDFASPLLLPLGLLGLWPRRDGRLIAIWLGWAAFIFVGWWFLTHRVDRFLLPALPLVCLLGGRAATLAAGTLWRCGITALLVAGLLSNLVFVTSRSIGDNRFLVALADLRGLGFSDANEFNPGLHPDLLLLNELVQPGYRVLACGEAQVFDLAVPVLYNTCFDDCVFEQLFKGKTRDERYAVLREGRISHVLVKWYELDRYRSPGNYGYSEYVTRELVRQELVSEQGLLEPIPVAFDPENVQIFEVTAWRSWAE